MQLIFLIGPPGSGKTVCGQELSRQLACRFFDTDHLIEQQSQCTVAEIFARQGEQAFRQLETELIEQLPSMFKGEERVVLATGGGLPVFNDNMQRLKKLGKVVALEASLPVLAQRLKGDNQRPLLATGSENVDEELQQRLSELLAKRSRVYELAGYKIDTSGLKPEQVAHEIIEMLSDAR